MCSARKCENRTERKFNIPVVLDVQRSVIIIVVCRLLLDLLHVVVWLILHHAFCWLLDLSLLWHWGVIHWLGLDFWFGSCWCWRRRGVVCFAIVAAEG